MRILCYVCPLNVETASKLRIVNKLTS